jgi:methylated-DNA-[protein]-cysteine S-methyltransferase
VVQAGGTLGGSGGGLEVKRWLLAHEAAHAPVLRSP